MFTGINALKSASNILRNRLSFMNKFSYIYEPTVSKNKGQLMELLKGKAETISKSELARKIRVAKGFYNAEMAPPMPAEMKKLMADLKLVKEFMKMGCYKYMTVKQAWLMFLVCLEVGLWFFIGETIGKMHLVGYKV